MSQGIIYGQIKFDAIHRFKEQKVKLILHASDFVSLGIIDELYFILL
jgi:hypothetical protein